MITKALALFKGLSKQIRFWVSPELFKCANAGFLSSLVDTLVDDSIRISK